MVGYLKKLCTEIQRKSLTLQKKRNDETTANVHELLTALTEEINRLDPRDFLPKWQYEFVSIRVVIRRYTKKTSDSILTLPLLYPGLDLYSTIQKLIDILENYGGEGSFAEQRCFPYISDKKLRNIVERDYKELSVILLPSRAWKSCVIIAGSILEAILYDLLCSKSKIRKKAMASLKAPRDKHKKVKDILKDEWVLKDLIEVATDISILPDKKANTIDQVLRDYRNFVHPKKEIKEEHSCDEPEAFMAKGALDSICNYFEKNLTKKSRLTNHYR